MTSHYPSGAPRLSPRAPILPTLTQHLYALINIVTGPQYYPGTASSVISPPMLLPVIPTNLRLTLLFLILLRSLLLVRILRHHILKLTPQRFDRAKLIPDSDDFLERAI